jgi:hypothetical protein
LGPPLSEGLRELEKDWCFVGLTVWRETRLLGDWYRFRIRPKEFDGNIHVYDIPAEQFIGGFVWGKMLDKAVAPYCHYEEIT